MADTKLQYELCPETGIGCLMVWRGEDVFRFDLLPDEAAGLQKKVRLGDIEGARRILVNVEPQAAEVLQEVSIEELSGEMGRQ